MHIMTALHQKHAVFTVDEALFPKLMALKYHVPEYKDVLIPRLGGLHTAMNFLGVIGQHMQDSGLCDVWIECDILGPNAAKQVMSGKGYARGIRAHKLTLQALWQLLLPQLQSYVTENNTELADDLTEHVVVVLVNTLTSLKFRELMDRFITNLKQDNPNAQFWWHYMEMVSILLLFIRAQRDGLWDLHLYAFGRMLPYFFRYDHINYARWGTVYLAEMNQLPPEVLLEFQAGNFVVKQSDRRFNQVDPDHGTEWLNATGKNSGGIVGITRTSSALSRWALSFNLRALIAAQTKTMLMLENIDEYTHNELTPSRMKKDSDDEDKVVSVLRRCNVFNKEIVSHVLQNIVTKDMATESIQASLICAENLGKEQLSTFIKDRLTKPAEGLQRKSIKEPIQKNKPPTFSSLYVVDIPINGKQTTMKVDRNILQRLITAYRAGRPVNLDIILKHELMPIPLALADTNHNIRSGTKSELANILTKELTTTSNVTLIGSTCLVIDGQALVMGLGNTPNAKTFGEFADIFIKAVFAMGANFERIDITFDRYLQHSIKDTTRQKRTRQTRPVRRNIENRYVPLPNKWTNYLALGENKAKLANFLSTQLLLQVPENKMVVVAGGFLDITSVRSTDPQMDTTTLEANHEEADTRIVLHCIHTSAQSVVVSARDTDVLLLLVAHFKEMKCKYLWMKGGTNKAPKYIPIHDLCQCIPAAQVQTLLAFHAITGCDSVSHIARHGKRSAFKVFEVHHKLLKQLGKGELSANTIQAAEKFLCRLYKLPNVESCDKARVMLFCKGHLQEALPPTSDAAHFHIKRSHYQTMVWKQANVTIQQLPLVTDMGWKYISDQLRPEFMSLTPIPQACCEIVSCGCTTGCLNRRCSCKKSSMTCTEACKCNELGCMNMID